MSSGETYLEVIFNKPVNSSFTYKTAGETGLVGYRVAAPFRNRSLTGFVISESNIRPEGNYEIKSIARVIDKVPVFGKREIDLAGWIASMYFCSPGEALSSMLPGGKRDSKTPAFDTEDPVSSEPRVLSEEQKNAVRAITEGSEKHLYLYGITGSGKTEVFLQAAEKIIGTGQGVIYLVPEISLSHQLTEQVKNRFENRVAVLHSALTPSQRLAEWQRIRNGDARLVIGARSAVFAPVEQLGLVIIDEEHEGSYKSGSTPRYHARQVAMKRVAAESARLVMGSATPSLEAYYLMRVKKIMRLDLSVRLSGGAVPASRTVDMRRSPGPLSEELVSEIRKTSEEGKQTILFLNRRGFSYFFHCRSCGWDMQCSHCSVSMTYHKNTNRMICHYCGTSRQTVSVCPECGSLDIGYSGFGTEFIEEEVRRIFPDLRVTRVDSDTARKKGSLESTLKSFREGDIDILLGTQMVAKGLNFPGVRLVGIILADSALHLPDFRAAEKTFSLITQVSGRAGRYSPDGLVLIQTYDPGNPAISMAAALQQDDFYEDELEKRKMLGFPPFSRLFRLVFRGVSESKVRSLSDRVFESFDRWNLDKTEILGPAECPVKKISGNFRYQILLRTKSFNLVHEAVAHLKSEVAEPGVYMEIDVDPVNLL